jgi:hypothetical protein
MIRALDDGDVVIGAERDPRAEAGHAGSRDQNSHVMRS